MQPQEKLKIIHRASDYEGIPASMAIGMALFESLGLGRLIDQRCRYDPAKRILSPGMVTKILLGPTFNIRNKYPLYLVNKAYTNAPLDRICGPGVGIDDITDYSLARGLDTLFDADLTGLFKECSDLAVKALGSDSHVLHMDSTDISVHCMEHLPDKEGAAVPRHNGHPKDNRPELLQYELQIVTDSNRVIRYMRPYDGNVSDSVMDRDTISDLARIFSEKEREGIVLVGDCKLATADNIGLMIDSGFGFVSKCAVNFKDGGFERARRSSVETKMHSCERRGLWMSDVDLPVKMDAGRTENLRFVAFRWDVKVDRRAEEIRAEVSRRISAIASEVSGLRFRTESSAMEYVEGIDVGEGLFRMKVRTKHCVPVYDPHDGWWALELGFEISERRVRRRAELDCTVVLVTNLARPEGRPWEEGGCERVPVNPEDRKDKDPVDGSGRRIPVADEEILAIYGREYKVERSFALMKSGLGMNAVYVQKPSRENAMMFVICIGVLLSNIADAMFRRRDLRLEGRPMTMYRLSHELQTTLVIYSRCDSSLRLQAAPEVSDRFFEYTDALGINPQLLLGYKAE